MDGGVTVLGRKCPGRAGRKVCRRVVDTPRTVVEVPADGERVLFGGVKWAQTGVAREQAAEMDVDVDRRVHVESGTVHGSRLLGGHSRTHAAAPWSCHVFDDEHRA